MGKKDNNDQLMDCIPRETSIVPRGKYRTIYAEEQIVVRDHDKAVGPFLEIEGRYDAPDAETEGYSHYEFFLCSAEEIDRFCNTLKKILRIVQESSEKEG